MPSMTLFWCQLCFIVQRHSSSKMLLAHDDLLLGGSLRSGGSESNQSAAAKVKVRPDQVLAAGGSWTWSRKNRCWVPVGDDKLLLATAGPGGAAALHRYFSYDHISKQTGSGPDRECHQGQRRVGGGQDQDRVLSSGGMGKSPRPRL